MGNFVIKNMHTGMSNSEGKAFPKMQVYTEFDYDKVVEMINGYSPAFSKGVIRGVLDTLSKVMKTCLPLGHTLKIDNLGVFSLALEFADVEKDEEQEHPQKQYHHVKAKTINFKVDQKLMNDINEENTFERSPNKEKAPSPYPLEERLQRALKVIDENGSIRLQEYANLNSLSRTSASRELAQLVADPSSGIKVQGSGPLKCWVRR
jgi:predicted histone-like DNA-binding protein